MAIPAYAQEETVAPLTFDKSSNSFSFPADGGQTANYLFAYRTDKDQTEAVLGQNQPIYAGTCSENGNCVDHQVRHGILKLDSGEEVRFALDNDQLVVVSQTKVSGLDLTDEENSWLENFTYQPAVSPSPTPLPSPSPQEEILGEQTETLNPSPSPALTETDSSPPVLTTTTVILETDLTSPDLDTIETNSAVLITDKSDYAPTEIVIISGVSFLVDETYTIIISSQDEPAVELVDVVTADDQGSFTYTYQLDVTYRPNYLVEVKNSVDEVVAQTSFTDSYPAGTQVLDPIANAGCMQTVYTNAGNNQTLNCTANDGGLSSANIVAILDDGCQYPGDTVTFTATYQLQSTASERYDVGVYLATDGDSNGDGALTGVCTIGTLPYGPEPPWYENDGDLCGEISSSGPLNPEFTITAKCIDGNNDNLLDLPYCTSYRQNANGVCSTPLGAYPGTSSKCSCGTLGSINITVPESAQIEVIKNLNPVAGAGRFNLQIDGTDKATNVGHNGTTGPITVGAGTSVDPGDSHTVGETAYAGTDLADYSSSISCVDRGLTTFDGGTPIGLSGVGPLSVPVDPSDDIVCTISNAVNQGTIIVEKQTNPDGVPGSFTFTGDAAGTIGDNGQIMVSGLNPGTYTAIETDPAPAFALNSIVCDDVNSLTASSGDLASRTATFNLDPGETVKCTFTNSRQNGHLIVQKTTDPAGDQTAFDIQASGSGTVVNGESGTVTDTSDHDYTVAPGTYSVNETEKEGWIITGNTCSNVAVGAGETKYCEITNTRASTIRIIKDANPNSAQDFSFTGIGSGVNSTVTLDDDGDQALSNVWPISGLLSGTYEITEGTVSGWQLTNVSCLGTTDYATDLNQGKLTINNVGPGSDITCTFTNIQQGSIAGYKLEDGLLNPLSGWTIFLDNNDDGILDPGEVFTTTDNDGYYLFNKLLPGIYKLSEVLQTGWTQISAPSGINLSAGQNSTNNNFVNFENVSIKACKQDDSDGDIGTVNDRTNVSGWTMTLYDDAVPVGTPQLTGADGCYTWTDLGPGNYSVTEETRTGWANLNNTSHGFGTLQSGSGESSWTFVNSRLGKVIVKKVMIGGVDTFDFTGDISGSISTNNGTIELDNVIPGEDKTSVETVESDWNVTDISCDDSDSVGDIPTRTAIFRVGSGETVTCTFTNSKLPTLTVNKIVSSIDPNESGKFNLQIDGITHVADVGNGGTTGPQIVSIGAHTVGEIAGNGTLLDLYASVISGHCASDGSITLTAGENKTCTITNTRKTGLVNVAKKVDTNGDEIFEGNDTVANTLGFRWQIDGEGSWFDMGTTQSYLYKTAGVNTYINENSIPGYHFVGWYDANNTSYSCSNPFRTTLPFGFTSSISTRSYVLCNAVDTGTLRVLKNVDVTGDGDYGEAGETGAIDWQWQATGPVTKSGNTGDAAVSVPIGNYLLTESMKTDYHQKQLTCTGGLLTGNTVTINKNATVVCTFENLHDVGKIELQKDWVGTAGGVYINIGTSEQASDIYSDWISGSDGASGEKTVNTGNYYVSETLPTADVNNYTSTLACYNDLNDNDIVDAGDTSHTVNTTTGQVAIGANDDVICVFTNTRLGSLKIIKDSLPNDAQDFTFSVVNGYTGANVGNAILDDDADGTRADNVTFSSLENGVYKVTETVVSGWELTNVNCATTQQWGLNGNELTVDVFNGEDVVCTFTNTRLGSISGMKFNDMEGDVLGPNEGDAGDPGIPGWTIELYKQGDGWEFVTSTQTDSNGMFLFSNLTPGVNYKVVEEMRTGWVPKMPNGQGYYTVSPLQPGQNIVKMDFGNVQFGSISGHKSDTAQNDVSGWTINLYQCASSGVDCVTPVGSTTTAGDGTYSFTSLLPGFYRISEDTTVPGWINQSAASIDLTLYSGDNSTDNNFVNFKLGSIQGRKFEDLNLNTIPDPGEQYLDNWQIRIYKWNPNGGSWQNIDNRMTGHTGTLGEYTSVDLAQGLYKICEVQQPGWAETEPAGVVNNVAPDEAPACRSFEITTSGQTFNTMDFGNAPLSSIHGFKFNDLNGNGARDCSAPGELTRLVTSECEPLLAGWKIFIDKNDNGSWDEGEPFMLTDDSQEHFGWYWFEDLLPGTYSVCEVPQQGWAQTSSPVCHSVQLPNGENTCSSDQRNAVSNTTGSCNFGNQLQTPILTLTKTNNAGGDKTPGDSVMFTLTVTATQSAALNVVLTDLPARGFTYQPGTWTYSSNKNPGLIVGEPSYASPGKWNLGDMLVGETITLTYLAQISGSQAPGLYTDLAWAEGESLANTKVLAMAEDPGYIEANFVGTQVKIITDDHDSQNLTGQVLGASTELPATGAQTLWLIIALAMIAAGAGSIKIGNKLKKKYD